LVNIVRIAFKPKSFLARSPTDNILISENTMWYWTSNKSPLNSGKKLIFKENPNPSGAELVFA